MREVKEVVKLFTPEEIKEYLDRIGMSPVEKPTKEALDEIISKNYSGKKRRILPGTEWVIISSAHQSRI